MKLTNNFWGAELDSATAVRDRLVALLPDIARRAVEQIVVDVGQGSLLDFGGKLGARRAAGGRVRRPLHRRGAGSDGNAGGWDVLRLQLETVSPDGAQAVSFLKEELREIGKRLGVRS